MIRISMLAVVVAFVFASCATHRGSSSFETAQVSQKEKVATPKIKSNEQLKAQAEAAEMAANEAKQKAQEQARQATIKAQEQAEAAKKIAAKALQEEAAQVRAQATEKAQEVKNTVEEKVEAVVDKTITEREEKAKVVESKGTNEGNYHIIIGTFKSLANARNVSSVAVTNGFLPSIMENDEGLYRVSIYTGNESNVRKKLVEIRNKFPEYAGVWIMKIK